MKERPLSDSAPIAFKGLHKIVYPSYQEISSNDAKSSLSTFFSRSSLLVLLLQEGADSSIKALKNYYGLMLEKGASTFFEDLSFEWKEGATIDSFPTDKPYLHRDYGSDCYKGYRMSLCHGWAGWPVAFLLYDIAGVKTQSNGSVTINPAKCSSIGDYLVGFLTRYGLLELEIKSDGTFSILRAPSGLKIAK